MIGLVNALITGTTSPAQMPGAGDAAATTTDQAQENASFLLMLSQMVSPPVVQPHIEELSGDASAEAAITEVPADTNSLELQPSTHASTGSLDEVIAQMTKSDETETLSFEGKIPVEATKKNDLQPATLNSSANDTGETIIDDIINWQIPREGLKSDSLITKPRVTSVNQHEGALFNAIQESAEIIVPASTSQLIHEAVASRQPYSNGGTTASALRAIAEKFGSPMTQVPLEFVKKNSADVKVESTISVEPKGAIPVDMKRENTISFRFSESSVSAEKSVPMEVPQKYTRVAESTVDPNRSRTISAPGSTDVSGVQTEVESSVPVVVNRREGNSPNTVVKNAADLEADAIVRVVAPALTPTLRAGDVTEKNEPPKSQDQKSDNEPVVLTVNTDKTEGGSTSKESLTSSKENPQPEIELKTKQASEDDQKGVAKAEVNDRVAPTEPKLSASIEKAPAATSQSFVSEVVFDVKPLLNNSVVEPKQSVVTSGELAKLVPIPEDFGRALMVRISDELKAHIDGKSSEVRVVMKPETMGDLSLRISIENGRVLATMDVSQPAVKSALEAQLPQLREALASQGIDVQRFDITGGSDKPTQHSHEGNAHQHSRGKHNFEVVGDESSDDDRRFGYNTVEYTI